MGLNKSGRGKILMNSFLISLSPVETVTVTGDNYSTKIYESLCEIFSEIEKNSLRVSSFFGYYFENSFILGKENNYKIMITVKKSEYFSSIIQKLFRKALNKETFFIDGNEFIIKGIISNDKIWTGYYNLDEIMEKNQDELCDNLKIKIVTPVIDSKDKFVFGFDKIFSEIIDSFERYVGENFDYLKENIRNIIRVKREKYYIKDIEFNSKIRKSYLGEFEIEIQKKEYINLIHAMFQFSKYSGIGKMSEYGFGQILIK